MAKKHKKSPTIISSQSLYPVVQDLTEVEYNNTPSGLCCGGGIMGGFSFEDLALPRLGVMPSSSLQSTQTSFSNSKRHKRGHSLFSLESKVIRNPALQHKRSSSEPAPNEDVSRSTFSTEDTLIENILFDDVYVLTRQIYKCNKSTVWECVHKEKGTRHCVKIVDKRRFTCTLDFERARREIEILKIIEKHSCQHLPRLLQVTEDCDHFFLVTELVEGGNLSTFLQAQEHETEANIKAIARSLLSGIAEMHYLSIGHFAISPDNILLCTDLNEVVICDFGCAWSLQHHESKDVTNIERNHPNGDFNSTASHLGNFIGHGQIHYTAPELVGKEKSLGLAADLWSIGVVLYELCSGCLPFQDHSKRELKKKIQSGKFHFDGKEWCNISRSAKQFICALLHPDPQIRMTVNEALTHPWLLPRTDIGRSNTDGSRKWRNTRWMKRILQKFRNKPDRANEPVEISPSALMSGHTLSDEIIPMAIDLSCTSTLSVDSNTTSSQHFMQSVESSLARPMETFRRLREYE